MSQPRAPLSALRAVAILVVVVAAVVYAVGQTFAYEVERELFYARSSGAMAFALLLASLAMSPLTRFSGTSHRRVRRALGLGAAATATAHLLFVTNSPLVPQLDLLIFEPHLRAGATAWVILAVLGATSFAPVIRRIGGAPWARLHRLVYAAVLLAWLHVALSSRTPVAWLLALAILILALLLMRLFPKKTDAPSLRVR